MITQEKPQSKTATILSQQKKICDMEAQTKMLDETYQLHKAN